MLLVNFTGLPGAVIGYLIVMCILLVLLVARVRRASAWASPGKTEATEGSARRRLRPSARGRAERDRARTAARENGARGRAPEAELRRTSGEAAGEDLAPARRRARSTALGAGARRGPATRRLNRSSERPAPPHACAPVCGAAGCGDRLAQLEPRVALQVLLQRVHEALARLAQLRRPCAPRSPGAAARRCRGGTVCKPTTRRRCPPGCRSSPYSR